ncbi:small glutamine-rich tetratricopeptide repeat-containing protein alpha-like [Daktulosphaira vitifoliae]|uniref:small glutamine-rich tetratricopeptide repeat-containing protein alpha-like n=1 Tax=Daktulosphaira vitifoliae TaxID=58002 RepID=UPI0021A978F5|nr:small glutamine-rich tetratricopeptide repeat-containing protein alpha-like [Daktulosphaira vitifoliae]XP_050528862.1 small glutamine-rich tetratricopeptide repeat-containing protein alpha-like [Daktulosphaira vitifoliae]
MEDKKKLAVLIVNHLKNQLNSGEFSSEALESLEVSVQCIESAYNINPAESDNIEKKLEDIVKEYFYSDANVKKETSNLNFSEVNDDSKYKTAEHHKNCGNEFMKNQNHEKAVEEYSKSVTLDPTNPIFYCNRAAAYNALGKYQDAIMDCQKAIELDSSYSKAYCRLGLAYSHMKNFQKAASCYKKAMELDPDNVGYQRNYQLTLNNLQGNQQQNNNDANTQPPNLMETAARLMSDPEVSSVLNNILGDVSNSGGAGLDRLMQVGQTIVSRLQTSNPNLLDGIRMQFQNAQNEGQPPQNGFSNDNNQS